MNIGSVSTRQLTKQEIINLIKDNFDDDPMETVCVLTTISEYKGEVKQSIVFKEILKY